MAPILRATNVAEIMEELKTEVAKSKVLIFSKTTCSYCTKVKDLFQTLNIESIVVELDTLENGSVIQEALASWTGQRTVPSVFINGEHIGGCDDTLTAHKQGRLTKLIGPPVRQYEFDLIVIGGGSGGLAASKAAAKLGKKVAVFDFIQPTPSGTSWGLGGTCVNVGCVPKKLMHQASLLGHALEDARCYGWQYDEKVDHNWETMRDEIQNHIGSLNWSYRVELRDRDVTYFNSYVEFIDKHTVKATNRRGKTENHTAETFIIATGGRPRYPDIEGAKQYGITSDDIFSLPYSPGKTLCIGASYVSLECAGFLAGLGFDTTVMVRSILLRGFDQDMANKVGEYMESHKVKFIRKTVPVKVELIEEGPPRRIKVTSKSTDTGELIQDEYNTVLFAMGRDPCTRGIGLEAVGVQLNPKSGYVVSPYPTSVERTSVDNIYAIGDILENQPELTPLAIQAGTLLAKRLYAGATTECDYINVPTTVFTPLEYGCCGLTEEEAVEKYGEGNLNVYLTTYRPLEYTVAHREVSACYGKIICLKNENDKLVGFHVLGPNAGEITQGFGVAMKCGVRKEHLDTTIGIHPTCAEVFTVLSATRADGGPPPQAGC